METSEPILRDIRQTVRSIERDLTELTAIFAKSLRLQTLATVRGLESERDKVELLDSAGFSPADIDHYLGKAPGYASVSLYQIHKKKQQKETGQKALEPSAPAPATSPPAKTLEATA